MKDRLTAEEVAPHGWVLVSSSDKHLAVHLDHCVIDGHWYVPAEPEPRTWTGTVHELRYAVFPWELGDDVVVTVTEVLP